MPSLHPSLSMASFTATPFDPDPGPAPFPSAGPVRSPQPERETPVDPSYLPPSLFVIGLLVLIGWLLVAFLFGVGVGRSIRNRDRQVPTAAPTTVPVDRP